MNLSFMLNMYSGALAELRPLFASVSCEPVLARAVFYLGHLSCTV